MLVPFILFYKNINQLLFLLGGGDNSRKDQEKPCISFCKKVRHFFAGMAMFC